MTQSLKKLAYLQSILEQHDLDALLLFDSLSFWHLAGTPMGEALLVPVTGEPVLFAKRGMADAAVESGWSHETAQYDPFRPAPSDDLEDLPHTISATIGDLELHSATIGIDETLTPFATIEALRKLEKETVFSPERSFLDIEMSIAQPHELEMIERTAKLADRITADALLGSHTGDRETDIAAKAAHSIFASGMNGYWFPPQVLSGERTALAIGRCSARRIRAGELLQVDLGVIHNGFTGDVTRTRVIGEPQSVHREMYNVVRAAVLGVLATIREGIRGYEVHAAARAIIDSSDFRSLCIHTGHPVGLPFGVSLVPNDQRRLREGMIVTVEPGVYAEGIGGVRIEEEVVLEKNGPRVLTHSLAGTAELE